MLRIVYFAKLRDDINASEESIEWQADFSTVGDIKALLTHRDAQWKQAFDTHILTAVNHTMAKDNHPISDNDEIAFFPPVTGG